MLRVWWRVTVSCLRLSTEIVEFRFSRRITEIRTGLGRLHDDDKVTSSVDVELPVVNAASIGAFEALLLGDTSDGSRGAADPHWTSVIPTSRSSGSLTILTGIETLGPAADPLDPQVGSMIGPGGRYEILERLGSGGQGDVFKARDTQHGDSLVAVKFYRRHTEDSVGVSAARRETKAMEFAAYPGMARAKYIERHCDYSFVVMEHVEGTNLRDLLESLTISPSPTSKAAEFRRFSSEACCWILEQLRNPLEHIHRLGLCHQDLKPANLMVNGLDPRAFEGFELATLKILDFGCAARFDVMDGHSSEAGPAGTLQYMPVEAFQSRDTSPERDVYSVAATIFHLRTNTTLAIPTSWRALRDKKALERCREHRRRQIAEFVGSQRQGSRADRRLAKAMARGLHENPALRPASVGHLLYLATGGRAGDSPSWRPSRRVVITAVATTLALAVAGASYAIDLDDKAVLAGGDTWLHEVTHAEAIMYASGDNPFPTARRTFRIRYANDLPGKLTARLTGSDATIPVDEVEDEIFEVAVDLPTQGSHEIKVLHRDREIFSGTVFVDTGIGSSISINYEGPDKVTPGGSLAFDLVFNEAVSIDVAWYSDPERVFFSSCGSLSKSHRIRTDSSPPFRNKGQLLSSGGLLIKVEDSHGNIRQVQSATFVRFTRTVDKQEHDTKSGKPAFLRRITGAI